MKLPEKKNEFTSRYNDGWNAGIEDAEYLCKKYDDESTKRCLLKSKEYVLKRKGELSYFKGKYDCLVEIEKLNEEDKEEENKN